MRFWPGEIDNAPKFIVMNKILVGALVAAAVAGVVWYLMDEEGFLDTVDDMREKADGALGKVKDRFSPAGGEAPDAV